MVDAAVLGACKINRNLLIWCPLIDTKMCIKTVEYVHFVVKCRSQMRKHLLNINRKKSELRQGIFWRLYRQGAQLKWFMKTQSKIWRIFYLLTVVWYWNTRESSWFMISFFQSLFWRAEPPHVLTVNKRETFNRILPFTPYHSKFVTS